MANITKPIALDETLQRVAAALEGQRKVVDVDGARPDADGHVALGAVRSVTLNGEVVAKGANGAVNLTGVVARDSDGNVDLTPNEEGGGDRQAEGCVFAGPGPHNVMPDAPGSVALGGPTFTGEGDARSFVWNGKSADETGVEGDYGTHGPGTFNINPKGGVDGVFIGDKPLSQLGLGGGGSRNFVYKRFTPKDTSYTRNGELELAWPVTITAEELGLDALAGTTWTFSDEGVWMDGIQDGTSHYPACIILQYLGSTVTIDDMGNEVHDPGEPCYVLWFTVDQAGHSSLTSYDFSDGFLPIAIWKYDGSAYEYDESMPGSLPMYYNDRPTDEASIMFDSHRGILSRDIFVNLAVGRDWVLGEGSDNDLSIGAVNVCIPYLDDTDGLHIHLPLSHDHRVSREAWLVVDLASYNVNREGQMQEVILPVVHPSGESSTWGRMCPIHFIGGAVHGLRYLTSNSENDEGDAESSAADSSDGRAEEEANRNAFYGRVNRFHLVEIGPDFWTIENRCVGAYTHVAVDGSSSLTDSNNM